MNKSEYKKKRQAIKDYAETNYRNLAKEYAFSNSTVKIGDIISGYSGKIKVDKIQHTRGGGVIASELPQCVYSGVKLKKNGEPFVNGERVVIYQKDMK